MLTNLKLKEFYELNRYPEVNRSDLTMRSVDYQLKCFGAEAPKHNLLPEQQIARDIVERLGEPQHPKNQTQCSLFSPSFGTKKSVSFSKVYIREHCVIIGDSLSSKSLPLSLGWGHAAEQTFDVNSYEEKKRDKKSPSSKRLSFSERLNLLRRVSGLETSDLMLLDQQRLHCASRRHSTWSM
jgi:hypothetical protein